MQKNNMGIIESLLYTLVTKYLGAVVPQNLLGMTDRCETFRNSYCSFAIPENL